MQDSEAFIKVDSNPKTFNIVSRRLMSINTDPQYRCYNGAMFSTKEVWSEFSVLERGIDESRIEDKLEFWRSLNAYAVSRRGKPNTLTEFKAVQCDNQY